MQMLINTKSLVSISNNDHVSQCEYHVSEIDTTTHVIEPSTYTIQSLPHDYPSVNNITHKSTSMLTEKMFMFYHHQICK